MLVQMPLVASSFHFCLLASYFIQDVSETWTWTPFQSQKSKKCLDEHNHFFCLGFTMSSFLMYNKSYWIWSLSPRHWQLFSSSWCKVLGVNWWIGHCKFLPPNVTALIQPMDQGVLEPLKRRYQVTCLRYYTLLWTARSFEVRQRCVYGCYSWKGSTCLGLINPSDNSSIMEKVVAYGRITNHKRNITRQWSTQLRLWKGFLKSRPRFGQNIYCGVVDIRGSRPRIQTLRWQFNCWSCSR